MIAWRMYGVVACLAVFHLVPCNADRYESVELKLRYEHARAVPSDIYQHVPVLQQLASECTSVVEIGVRSMVSTWGLLYGLAQNSSSTRSYLGIDLVYPPDAIYDRAKSLAVANGINFQFWTANDLFIDIPETELLFIDSLHTYCHLSYELETFSSKVSKYIVMHDTSAPWGDQDDNQYFGDYTEYSPRVSRVKRGLWPAVCDFLVNHPEWIVKERLLNNHGLTILVRTN